MSDFLLKSKIRIIKFLNNVIHFYDRRKSQYTHTGKIALCCIAKMENDYIRFFVEYYQQLGFDKIFIYDNNDTDGERFEEVISDYMDNSFVEVIDYRGGGVVQLKAYQDCYDRYNKEYDWIAFFDCDEFLTFQDGTEEIHHFFDQKKFMPFQLMHINWKCYDDNNLLDNDGRDVIERFDTPIPYDTKGPWNHLMNEHVKSIIRGGLSKIVWNHTTHTPVGDQYRCCNPEGYAVDMNDPFQEIHYETAFLRHYSTKTIGEWVRIKWKRGSADLSEDDWRKMVSVDFFFKYYNVKTAEKMTYAKNVLMEIGMCPDEK